MHAEHFVKHAYDDDAACIRGKIQRKLIVVSVVERLVQVLRNQLLV